MRAFTGEQKQVETPTLVEELGPAPLPPEPQFDAEATIAASSFDRRVIADAPVPEVEPLSVQHAAVEPAAVEPATVESADREPPVADVFGGESDIAAQAPPEAADRFFPITESAAEPADVPAPLALEPEIDFSETEKPQKSKPDVKTVKVRSSVDVMAELEALRKRATNSTTKTPAKRDVLADLDSLRPKRDLNRTLHLQLPSGVLSRTKSVRVTLSFEDGEAAVIDTQNQHLDLGDASDVQSLSVNLKIDLA
jgi:hypothetical protein